MSLFSFQPVSSMMRIATPSMHDAQYHLLFFQPVSSMMRIATAEESPPNLIQMLPAGVQYDEDCDTVNLSAIISSLFPSSRCPV